MEISEFSIDNMINIEAFISIQSELANIVNFSTVTVRPDGVPIGPWSNFTSFCGLIRSSPVGYKECIYCDKCYSLSALEKGHPLIYDCHCGLKDCAAPIVVNNSYIGCVLGGQVLIDEADREKIDIHKIANDFDLPIEKLEEVRAQIDVVSEEYLQRCINFYSFLAHYVSEISVKNIIQEKLTAETTEKMRLQELAKEQELKRIQAQMNPHFLFNALNSIARTALLEDAAKTENLLYDLSEYLRYNIKNTEEMPKLDKELENLRHYLSIQKTRFADRLHYIIDVEHDILDWCIPSMTLQPIVENAIMHGLETKREGGIVKIIGKKIPGKMEMYVQIQDNGIGFDPGILRTFNQTAGPNSTRLGLGLLNTHARIRHLFGANYGITIESTPDIATTITIKLPRKL
jgi:Putative regulator of cell autolysis